MLRLISIILILIPLINKAAYVPKYVYLSEVEIYNINIINEIKGTIIPYIDSIGDSSENTVIGIIFKDRNTPPDVIVHIYKYPNKSIIGDPKGYTVIDGFDVVVYGCNQLRWKILHNEPSKKFEIFQAIIIDDSKTWYYKSYLENLYLGFPIIEVEYLDSV